MKLIVGLGNHGEDYIKTRHNLGYMIVDEICKALKVSLKTEKKLKAELCITMINGETVILAKPITYMNLSGDSISKISNFYKIQNPDIWVISDDLALEFGTVRVRVGGSSGGHNGLKDIIAKMGDNFTRFRVGIKNDKTKSVPSEKFVLQKFSKEEQQKLEDILKKSSKLVLESLKNGVSHTSIQ